MAEELNITIRAKDEASAQLQKVAGAIADTGAAADGAASAVEGFSGKNLALGVAVGAAALAVAGLAAAFGTVDLAVNAALAGIERGGMFDDLSKKVGVSVESLSRMDVAATASGISIETLATSYKFLQKNMVAAAEGGEAQAASFASIGVAVRDSSGNMREANEVLLDAADAFSRMEPSAQRTALAMEIFGKAGSGMMPFLLEGREGLEKFAEVNDKLGLTLTGEMSGALDAVGDSMSILGRVGDGVAQQFAIGLAPALVDITTQLVNFVSEVGISDGTIASFGATIGDALRSGFEKVRDTVIEIKEIFTTLDFDDAMAVMGTKLNHAMEAAFESAIWAAARAAKNVFLAAVDWVFGSVDIAAIAKTKNEKLIRESLDDLERQLRTRIGQDTSGASDIAKHDIAVRDLVAGIDTLKGRLGELAGAQLVADASAAKATKSFHDQQVEANLSALGITTAGDSFRFYEHQGVLAVATTEKHTAAKKAEKSAVEQATDAVNKSTQSLADAAAKQEARNATIEDGLAAGDSYATILDDIAQAELAIEAAQQLETGATLEAVAAWVAKKQAADGATESAKAWDAALDASKEVTDIKAEIAVWEEVKAKIITVEQAHHKLAVAKEIDKKLTAEQAEEVVKNTEAVEKLRTEYDKTAETGIDAWGAIDTAFNEMADGLIAGTLDMGDIWKSFATGMVKEMVNSLGGVSGLFTKFLSGLASLFSGSQGSFDLSSLFSLANGSVPGGGGGGGNAGWLSGLFGGGGGSLGTGGSLAAIALPLLLNSGGFLSNPGASIGLSAASLANSAWQAAGGAGIVGALFGDAISTTTIGSLIGETGSGLVTSLFGEAGSAALETSLGAFGAGAGAVLGGAGGAYGVWNLVQGGQSGIEIAASLLAVVAGGAAILNAFGPIGIIIYAIILALTAIASAFTDITPTAGTLRRRAAESLLDGTKTFDALQDQYGDLTRTTNNLGSSPKLTEQRERLGGDSLNVIQGFATVFAQLGFGSTNQGAFVADITYQWTNILTDFFSRMGGESEAVSAEIKKNLLAAFKDLGVGTAAIAFEQLNKAAAPILFSSSTFAYLEEAVDPALLLGATMRGVGAIFETELPAGVHIAALALESMKNEGVSAFGELDTEGHETLLNLADDAENFDKVVAKLFKDGFQIDVEEFKTRLAAITASAQFMGANLAEIFKFADIGNGIQAVMQNLKATIFDTFQKESLAQLFNTTNIAAAFEPVFLVMNRIKEFDLTTKGGSDSFLALLGPALTEGKANLQDYIPVLKQIAANWREIQEVIDEALAPDIFEQAAAVTEQAFGGIAQSLSTAIDAGLKILSDGGTYEEAVTGFTTVFGNGVEQSFKTAIFNAIVQTSVIEPLLQSFTPAFQYVIAAGLALGFGDPRVIAAMGLLLDDVKTKAESLGLIVFNAQIDSDQILSPIQKAFNDAAPITLKWADDLRGSMSRGMDAAFDVLRGGGTRDEAIAAWSDAIGDGTAAGITEGIVRALINAAIIEPFVAQWTPIIQYYTAVGLLVDPNDPVAVENYRQAGLTLFGPDSAFQQGLNNIPNVAIDWYFNYAGGEPPPGYEEEYIYNTDRDVLGPTHLADGGTIGRGGMAIVGEAGAELMFVHGGGATIIPLNGVPMMADGGMMDGQGNLIPIGVGPGTGPFGRPRIPPYAPPPPRDDDSGSGDEDKTINVSFSFNSAIEDFIKSGKVDDLSTALEEATGKGIIAGMITAMLAQAGLDEFQKEMGEKIKAAMEDGKIDPEELVDIETLGEDFKTKLQEMAEVLGPAFAEIAETFGIDMGDAIDPTTEYLTTTFGAAFEEAIATYGIDLEGTTAEALTKGGKASADAIGGALRSVLNDPSKMTMENLTASLKQQIYQSVSQGLIEAFIQGAVIQGALAVPLGIINAAFAAVAAGQMSAAQANVTIAEQVGSILDIINGPDFQAMMQPMLDGLKELASGLGQTGTAVEASVPPFQEAAAAAENACAGQCDLEYKLATAQLGIGNLTEQGGAGAFGIEYYAPQRKLARGGLVRGALSAMIGEAGDEIVLPLSGAEAQEALAAAAAGFAMAAAATSTGNGESADALTARQSFDEMKEALKAQQASQRESDASLRTALAETVAALTARPVSVEIDGREVAKATVDFLERRSRGGSSSLDRVR